MRERKCRYLDGAKFDCTRTISWSSSFFLFTTLTFCLPHSHHWLLHSTILFSAEYASSIISTNNFSSPSSLSLPIINSISGGSWSTCMIGSNKSPPQDVAHLQFKSRIAFKLVWSPPQFNTVRYVRSCFIIWQNIADIHQLRKNCRCFICFTSVILDKNVRIMNSSNFALEASNFFSHVVYHILKSWNLQEELYNTHIFEALFTSYWEIWIIYSYHHQLRNNWTAYLILYN